MYILNLYSGHELCPVGCLANRIQNFVFRCFATEIDFIEVYWSTILCSIPCIQPSYAHTYALQMTISDSVGLYYFQINFDR